MVRTATAISHLSSFASVAASRHHTAHGNGVRLLPGQSRRHPARLRAERGSRRSPCRPKAGHTAWIAASSRSPFQAWWPAWNSLFIQFATVVSTFASVSTLRPKVATYPSHSSIACSYLCQVGRVTARLSKKLAPLVATKPRIIFSRRARRLAAKALAAGPGNRSTASLLSDASPSGPTIGHAA